MLPTNKRELTDKNISNYASNLEKRYEESFEKLTAFWGNQEDKARASHDLMNIIIDIIGYDQDENLYKKLYVLLNNKAFCSITAAQIGAYIQETCGSDPDEKYKRLRYPSEKITVLNTLIYICIFKNKPNSLRKLLSLLITTFENDFMKDNIKIYKFLFLKYFTNLAIRRSPECFQLLLEKERDHPKIFGKSLIEAIDAIEFLDSKTLAKIVLPKLDKHQLVWAFSEVLKEENEQRDDINNNNTSQNTQRIQRLQAFSNKEDVINIFEDVMKNKINSQAAANIAFIFYGDESSDEISNELRNKIKNYIVELLIISSRTKVNRKTNQLRVKQFLSLPLSQDIIDNIYKKNLLYHAVMGGLDNDIILLILKLNPEAVNTVNQTTNFAVLELAARFLNPQLVDIFINNGANTSPTGQNITPPLHAAIWQIVHLADFNKVLKKLTDEKINAAITIIQSLTAANADINQIYDGRTPLHLAIESCVPALVTAVFACGADINIASKDGAVLELVDKLMTEKPDKISKLLEIKDFLVSSSALFYTSIARHTM